MGDGPRQILVAGGAGFIGSHLCDRLIARGDQVLCIDNLWTGRMANIEHLLARPNFRFQHHDVTHPLDVSVDEIYNLACPASLRHCLEDAIHTLKTSFLGSLMLLELARRNDARILLASTSEIYGDPTEHPQAESYFGNVNPVGPRASYDEGKRSAETLFNEYQRQFGIDAKIARIFNTYGPRMSPDDGRAIANFVVQSLKGEAVTVYGDGRQTRSFCYVDDLVDGLMILMGTGRDVAGPVNLGNEAEITILQLARTILALCDRTDELAYAPLPAEDPRQRRPALGRARQVLGWSATVGLEDGLRRTIEYFRAEICKSQTAGASDGGTKHTPGQAPAGGAHRP